MTMQVVVEARNGLVLGSDLKHRLNGGIHEVSSFTYHSKVALSGRHNLLISMKGMTADPSSDPAGRLAAFLEHERNATREVIQKWAEEYVDERTQRMETDCFDLLLLHPSSPNEEDQIWKLIIEKGNPPRTTPRLRNVVFNGNENNPGIMWTELFKFKSDRDLYQCSILAALTILTASDIAPSAVDDLELWQFRKKWRLLSRSEIAEIKKKYLKLKARIENFLST